MQLASFHKLVTELLIYIPISQTGCLLVGCSYQTVFTAVVMLTSGGYDDGESKKNRNVRIDEMLLDFSWIILL